MARGPDYYRQRAAQYARGVGLDPRIFQKQIGAESGFRPGARSPAGAVGIAQIVPRWHPDVDPTRPGNQRAGVNPEVDLKYAAQHMASTLRKYKGSYKDALSVYNSGRPWSEGKSIDETRKYVAKILNGEDPANNARIPSRVPGTQPGNNDYYGGGSHNPRNLASFLLSESQKMAAGGGYFDLGGMSQAMKADRDESMAAMQGMDPGGGDPGDPRVTMQQPANVPRGKNAAATMRMMVAQARKMGLSVSGNELVTGHPEKGGHTSGSDHYKYLAPGVQGAIDVSGKPKQQMAYYRWLERNRAQLGLKDAFYDPAGRSIDEGKPWDKTIGGHTTHVHASLFPTTRRR